MSSSVVMSVAEAGAMASNVVPNDGQEGLKSIDYQTLAENGDRNGAPSLHNPTSTREPRPAAENENKRLSFSSLLSIGSLHGGGPGLGSQASSIAGSFKASTMELNGGEKESKSPRLTSPHMETPVAPTTATDNVSTLSSAHSFPAGKASTHGVITSGAKGLEQRDSGSLPRLQNPGPENKRSRSRTSRRPSVSTGASSASPHNSDRAKQVKAPLGKIGVCALDGKARSKPSRNILTRLQSNGDFEVIVFGDKVILDEEIICGVQALANHSSDYLISFFSEGFPLDKAIAYTHLRKPFCVNDLPMQKILWDRRLCLKILDHLGVPTPQRLEVNRDGGPMLDSESLVNHVYRTSGIRLRGPNAEIDRASLTKTVELSEDEDTLIVDGVPMKKPFVEKPVSGEDHNICIYFPKSKDGGGGRRLFRKVGNKSSEWDSSLVVPRAITEESESYLYEQFLDVENAEDVKAYTVGPEFCHAETRKSPVVDGLVRRNTHGKEIRYITSLSKEEASMASRIAQGFGQRICGFDMLRAQNRSFVIDVNGWSFVKDNNEYYDKCSRILREMFIREREKKEKIDPPSKSTVTEGSIDGQADATIRPNPPHHRDTLKGIFKTPSFSKLKETLHHRKTNVGDSAEGSFVTTPISSPPTTERPDPTAAGPQGISIDHSESTSLGPSTNASISRITSSSADHLPAEPVPLPAAKHSWKLKGMVAVIRHADRTPKQKFKFTFHTQPFIELLKGHQEEVLLKGEDALSSVLYAVEQAIKEDKEDMGKLHLLKTTLLRKGSMSGTKVQIKPMFRKRKPEEIAAKLSVEGVASKLGDEKSEEITEEALHLVRTGRSDSLAGITLSRYAAAENDLVLDKLQLVLKWGGEPTHSARYQSQDLGENMRNDLLLLNRDILGDVRVFTSSEPRVSTSAQIWAASFLNQKDIPDSFISVRKDLLDDSNAAKDVMDKVKKKLKGLLREGHEAPSQFAWPPNTPEPSVVVRQVAELMQFHRKVMRHNFNKLNSASSSLSAINSPENSNSTSPPSTRSISQAEQIARIQARWCTNEDAELFKERWEKLFSEFADAEKVDPSKISELYDTMKYDALHNRQFLEWVFTPSASVLEEISLEEEGKLPQEQTPAKTRRPTIEKVFSDTAIDESSQPLSAQPPSRKTTISNSSSSGDRTRPPDSIAQRMGFRRKTLYQPPVSPTTELGAAANSADSTSTSAVATGPGAADSYFKLYNGNGSTRAKQDARLLKLRELYRAAKILFDFICPQEYGISDAEKLEIGLLTSLPLLKEIVADLEEVQASEGAKSFIYFTKESHVYTLLNAILGGGIRTRISRNAIPELDYLSQIAFELYEAEDKEADAFAYSISISITPGCHTQDPLDVQLDSKHSIGCAPRRSLTAHQDWKEVIGTLRARFHTVSLPKSFLAVNLSGGEKEGGKQH